MKRGILLAVIAFFICSTSSTTIAQYGYYYSGKDYGSEAIFNPLNQVISGGFDMIFILNESSKLSNFDVEKKFSELTTSLRYPNRSIKDGIGWETFIKSEVLISPNYVQWIPNYSLHMIGGGMEYARLIDYYTYHNIKYPKLSAFLTSTTEHLLNEMVENIERDWLSHATIADIYLFNNLGMIAFSFEPVQRFFSESVSLRSWLSQTAYSLRDNSVRNVGQNYSIKWQPPFMNDYSLFTYFGLGTLVGVGKDVNDKTFSFGGGFKSVGVFAYDEFSYLETVIARPSIGIFIDKENSLLAALTYTHSKNYTENIKMEIYPGFIPGFSENFNLGFWVNVSFDYNSYIGITLGNFPSIGF